MVLEILLWPAILFLDMCENIKEMADAEMLITLESIKRKFLETHTAYENKELNEVEYSEAVEFLSNRLTQLQNFAEKRG